MPVLAPIAAALSAVLVLGPAGEPVPVQRPSSLPPPGASEPAAPESPPTAARPPAPAPAPEPPPAATPEPPPAAAPEPPPAAAPEPGPEAPPTDAATEGSSPAPTEGVALSEGPDAEIEAATDSPPPPGAIVAAPRRLDEDDIHQRTVAAAMLGGGGLALVGATLLFISVGVEAAKPACSFGLKTCSDPPRHGLAEGLGITGGLLAAGGIALVTLGAIRLHRIRAAPTYDGRTAGLVIAGRF